jgi:hypothetical protein
MTRKCAGCRRAPSIATRSSVERSDHLQVLKDQYQRPLAGENVDRFGELAKHACLRRPLNPEVQCLQPVVGHEPRHLHEPRRRVPRQDLDDAAAVSGPARRPEGLEDRKVRLARAKLFDARAGGDQGTPGESDLGNEGIDERGFSNPRVTGDEEHSPLLIENGLEDVPQDLHLPATPHEAGPRWRLLDLRRDIRGLLRRDFEEKAVAAPHNGLDHAIAEHTPNLGHVRPEKALAHRDFSPDGLHDLLLRRKTQGVLREESQDRERLATELQLVVPSPQALLAHVEAERAEHAHVRSPTGRLPYHVAQYSQASPCA